MDVNPLFEERYPESAKQLRLRDKSEAAGEFADWLLNDTDIILAHYPKDSERLVPTNRSIESLLAEWLGINLPKLDAEKEQILDETRNAQQ